MGISSRGQHFHEHTVFFKKDQGTSEQMKIGQEKPNLSDNISVTAAPFREFSRGMLDLQYILRRKTGGAESGQALSAITAGSHPQ